MYLPKHFLVEDPAILAQLISEYPLANIVGTLDGHLEINHLPLMLSADKTKLYGHIAKMNPLTKVANSSNPSVTAIFNGPNAYVTPSWYPSKKESGKIVPTWNYAAVHAEGTIKLIDDLQWLRSHVSQMTNIHEPPINRPGSLMTLPRNMCKRCSEPSSAFRLTSNPWLENSN